MSSADAIVIGAGIYGLYSALLLGKKKKTVYVLEMDEGPMLRATKINQARVHQGYHYPRSLYTAARSAGYFERFLKDYSFCINKEFRKVYGISSNFSMTDGGQFAKFARAASIPYEEVDPNAYFKEGMCEAAFLTREYTYDVSILRDHFMAEIAEYQNIKVLYNTTVTGIRKDGSLYTVASHDKEYSAPVLVNTGYASVNQIMAMAELPLYRIKYELCEIILCRAEGRLKDLGITVMDGPFFSIMPYGNTGYHSLTSVTFTPHESCHKELPDFSCMKLSEKCSPACLYNCNDCEFKPHSSDAYMSKLARKYMLDDLCFERTECLFSVKPILEASEVDDSRPTLVNKASNEPVFISVLSGKINTIYDLDSILSEV
ncbi:MAG: FAD-binding oxidoreductase [Lachnospiraceae bacterium]|nr:FAD-binding oxidoreductase [Lachnospiraceae bacterium]